MQQSLFEMDPYGGSAPIVRATDPESSHEAAARHTASGARQRHAEIALALVRRMPGSTCIELFETTATNEEQKALGSSVELMRRLGDLRASKVIGNGEQRLCKRKGTKMITWILI